MSPTMSTDPSFGGFVIYGSGGGGEMGRIRGNHVDGEHITIDAEDIPGFSGGGAKSGMLLMEFIRYLSGSYSAGTNAGSRFDSSDDVVNKWQNYTIDQYNVGQLPYSSAIGVHKSTRDTFMRPADYNNTNWEARSLYDSVKATNRAKQLSSPGKAIFYFSKQNGQRTRTKIQ